LYVAKRRIPTNTFTIATLHWIQLSTHLRPSCSIEGFLQKCCLDRRDPKFETIAKALFHPNKHRFYDGNKIGRFRRMLNEC
jgi:hypothetical protein